MVKRPRTVDDELLGSWLKTLKPQTAKNYKACFVRLLGIMKTDCKTLLENAERDPIKTWKEIKQAAKQIEAPRVRLNACYAARKFLLDQNEDMMLPKSNLRQPELSKEPAYLSWDEAQKVCDAASSPYNLVFRIMLHSGWGAGEFLQFNKEATWAAVKAKLATGTNGDYFRFGFKGRKKNRRPFYSLVPTKVLGDAVALEAQSKIVLPLSAHGPTIEKAKGEKKTREELIKEMSGMPLDDTNIETTRRYMESAFKTALRRAPIILTQGSPSLHELRDTFLTRAVQVGCSDSAANFCMGHALDKLGYNKCDRDEAWVWSELRKIHGPAFVTEDRITELEKENRELKRMFEEIRSGFDKRPMKPYDEIMKEPRAKARVMRSQSRGRPKRA
jgi:integrase